MKDLGKKIGKPFKDGYEIIKNKTKDIRENVKNWFGKTKESAEEKLTGLKQVFEKEMG